MKRGGPLRRRTPLTAKRSRPSPERLACRAAVIHRDGERCRGAPVVPEVACWGRPEVHEKVQRSLGGSDIDPANCILLCSAHHRWIDSNIQSAVDRGLLDRSWDPRGEAG